MSIIVVDYNAGNLTSVMNALEHIALTPFPVAIPR